MAELDYQTIKDIMGVSEDFEMPTVMLGILMKPSDREKLFNEFIDVEEDLSYDWFRNYFQQAQADRKTNKQDFTPLALTQLVASVCDDGGDVLDPAAGTGGISIASWVRNPNRFFQAEELTSATVPFLLFNFMVRNMRGAIIHGDSLARETNQVYLLRPSYKFSQLTVLPHNEQVQNAFDIEAWNEDAVDYIEFDDWQNDLPAGAGLDGGGQLALGV